jgi:hypothetical protein
MRRYCWNYVERFRVSRIYVSRNYVEPLRVSRGKRDGDAGAQRREREVRPDYPPDVPYSFVPGYRARLLAGPSPDDVISSARYSAVLGAEDRARLRALRGQRLVRSWAIWGEWTFREPDGRVGIESGWYEDTPVILEFETTRLELAQWKMQLCLSWDTIDIAQGVDWSDAPHANFWCSRTWWQPDGLEPLAALRDPLDEVLTVDGDDGLGFGFRAGTALALVFEFGDELNVSDVASPGMRLTPV